MGFQHMAFQLQAIVEAITGAQITGELAVTIVIRVTTAWPGVDAPSGQAGHRRAVPAPTDSAGYAGTALMVVTAAGRERHPGLGITPGTALGENLDHPTDGFGAIQAGTWPAHDLDAFDLLDGQVVQRRA